MGPCGRRTRKEDPPVSMRHHSSRRRNYGRRQHELRERSGRRYQPDPIEHGFDDQDLAGSADPLAFLDPRAPRLRFAIGD